MRENMIDEHEQDVVQPKYEGKNDLPFANAIDESEE